MPASYTDKKTLDEKYPDRPVVSESEDPGMVKRRLHQPPRIKRQFRDPYATWWDPQERRNFGEPVHEDNDVLGIFSPWEYTWTTTGPGLIMVGTFIAVFLGVSGVVYMNYPDKPSYPREFEGGLERELGGPGAVRLPAGIMRYQDWDVLLFPADYRIPFKEFKVACHVVHDAVSIHSWSTPAVSRFTRAYSECNEAVEFEARLYIDGRLVAYAWLFSTQGQAADEHRSTTLNREYCSPHVIAHTCDPTKDGKLEPLRFPIFRRELLFQRNWSPADDLGRIKLILSEGFPRVSPSLPIERVKNIVVFSFQHAPLAGNAVNFLERMDGNLANRLSNKNDYFDWLIAGGHGIQGTDEGATQQQSARRMGTDISMPDYTPMSAGDQSTHSAVPGDGTMAREEEGPLHLRVPTNTPTTSGVGSFEYEAVPFPMLSHNPMIPTDLANSLANSLLNQPMSLHFQPQCQASQDPAMEVKSRKEIHNNVRGHSPSDISMASIQDHSDMRRVSQQMFVPSGGSLPVCMVSSQANSPQNRAFSDAVRAVSQGGDFSGVKLPANESTLGGTPATTLDRGVKRARTFSPTSARAIDKEDEARASSPSVRLTPYTDIKGNAG
ncbi:NADH dehydrogenase (ubiquinone)-like protein [Purpureocillium lavendulum]|uniref:NADH dehydrogenase (Ubiquinone)-like protein n=1 Tax=Purpureocillium lavendulum TaxID=1247861 RepID=A0AB34G3C6_9HYPO|nr:NADH dehydrogenase (ubiquinone)-like protein [Purpureocillium lavendulum]